MALIENLIEKIDPCFLFDRGFENFIPYYLKICQVETRVLIGQYSKGHSSLEAKLEAPPNLGDHGMTFWTMEIAQNSNH